LKAKKLQKHSALFLNSLGSERLPERCKFTNEMDIYADKVSMISLDNKNLYGIIIQSKSVADTQRNIYELLWNLL